MRTLWIALSFLLHATLSIAHGGHAVPTPLQFCHANSEKKTDLCLALSSYMNSSTNAKDLRLHLSARFFEPRSGWAAFGIGKKMDSSLMFVMYPGSEVGDVTVSVRSTVDHHPPQITKKSPDIRVIDTWVDTNGIHNAQLVCYACENWKGSKLNVASANQPWLWAANDNQPTGTVDPMSPLKFHTDFGVAHLDMSSSFSSKGEGAFPKVSDTRISMHPLKSNTLNMVVVHGVLLGGGFFFLTAGILAIRSGLAKSFVLHWMIQISASVAILIGCLLGIRISFAHGTFITFHQLFGLSIPLVIALQTLFGYFHHLNFKKLSRRTTQSYYHIWLGRAILIGGNINIGFGLKLAEAPRKNFIAWYVSILVQLFLLLPTWYFWRKGKPILGSREIRKGKGNAEIENLEQEAFIVGDEFDDENEQDRKFEELELK